MKERRRLPRRHLMFHLRVFDSMTGDYVGNLFDISHDGIMLVGEKPMQVGQRRSLEMQLPVEVFGRGRVSFAGTPAWSTNDIQPELHDIGLGELRMEDGDRAVLERLIAEYGTVD